MTERALVEIKAVLFDLDGTLLDTLSDLADAMNVVLADMGLPCHPDDAYRYFVGDGLEILARRVLPQECRKQPFLSRCIEGMKARYSDHWADNSKPYAGIADLLNELTCRDLNLAVLSNKPDYFTSLLVNHFLPHWRWSHVRGARLDTPRKPDPCGALAIAEQLALAPRDFLYLGDTATDMQTARAAGMYPVGVSWGFRTVKELEESGAKVVLDHPLDLLKLLP